MYISESWPEFYLDWVSYKLLSLKFVSQIICVHRYVPIFIGLYIQSAVQASQISSTSSSVQRLLDARGQRGSRMPSKIFYIPLAKFLTTFFLVVHLNFSLFSHQLSNFTRIRSLDALPVLHHAPVTTFFTSFLVIYLHFLKKTGPLDAPQGGCPGPSHRPRLALHETEHFWVLRLLGASVTRPQFINKRY